MGDSETPAPAAQARVPFVDLVLGAWRPREAATQLANALGIALPEWRVAGDVSDAIEAEAEDDRLVAWAFAAAARIGAVVPAGGTIAVLAPRFGLPLRPDDEWLFLFLKRRNISIALIGDEPATPATGRPLFERRRGIEAPGVGTSATALTGEQRRALCFFPGLLPKRLATRLHIGIADAFLVPAGPDHFLIPPAWRDIDPRAGGRDLDAMEALEATDDAFMGLAQTFCTAHFADSAAIAALSDRMERQGAVALAAELAERARQVARTTEAMATTDVRRLEVWCEQRRFADMLALPPPSRQAGEATRARITRLRLEAAVAAGELAGIDADLAALAAGLDGTEPVSPEDRVLLDRAVEALGAAGQTDRAVALAERLAARSEGPDAKPALAFRHALTRARLHGRRDEPDRRRATLDAAFATSAGIRSLGEVAAMNALRAAAETEPASEAGRLSWLRVSLAWLALEPPEALSADAIRAVLGQETRIVRPRLALDIGDTLADRLEAAWPGLAVRQDEEYPAVRAMSEADRPKRLFGGPGAAILWLDPERTGPVYIRPRARLARLVKAALTALCPDLARRGNGAILVDTNLGLDLPADREAALSVALRARVDEAFFGEETIRFDAASCARLAAGLSARLGPAVRIVEGDETRLTVRFRRRLGDASLTGVEAEAVAALREGGRMALGPLAVMLGRTVVETERLYREIEATRIVRLDYHERAVAQDSGTPPAAPAAGSGGIGPD